MISRAITSGTKFLRFAHAAIVFLVCLLFTDVTQAHEVRPAFLKLAETQTAQFSAVWKQPVLDGKRLKIKPVFPDECETSLPQLEMSAGTIRETFSVSCTLTQGFLSFDGLERTLTDIFIEISYLDKDSLSGLVKPANPTLDLSTETSVGIGRYLMIGVDHILRGWDHLLFVICLTMMVSRRQIIGVATSFTLAHSLTLGLAVFGLITLPIRPIEILIAASIVLMAVEIMRKFSGQSSLALRRPYLLSFLIGLIHGCGFASALGDIGLPKGTELLALLLFNLGVELGQVAVIILMLILFWGIGRIKRESLRPAQIALTYGSAAMAMFWFFDRTKDYFI